MVTLVMDILGMKNKMDGIKIEPYPPFVDVDGVVSFSKARALILNKYLDQNRSVLQISTENTWNPIYCLGNFDI